MTYGNTILVQSIYRCNHTLPDSTTRGHQYTSTSPEILESLPRYLKIKFPFKLYHCLACSQGLLDYLIVHIGRGHNFLELAEDIASLNFWAFLQLHQDSAEHSNLRKKVSYTNPATCLAGWVLLWTGVARSRLVSGVVWPGLGVAPGLVCLYMWGLPPDVSTSRCIG